MNEEYMELINGYARRELSADEVYVFPVKLCDNEVDRDGERFSIAALERLAKLYVGKTGITDHEPHAENQTARIFAAEVVSDPERRTSAGEVYTYVRAQAYTMRTEKTAALIAEIDGGIKKEVSVACSVRRRRCSICGADRNTAPCSHQKGEYYAGKRCVLILDEPTDAYEWSFVAVPAQPEAGVTKSLGDDDGTLKALRGELDGLRSELAAARQELETEVVRLGQFCTPAYSPQTVKQLCGGMSIRELVDFKEKTRRLATPERQHSVLYEKGDSLKRFKMKR